MSNNCFSFQQFKVCQVRSAMKVGTDGVLLGAWCEPDREMKGTDAHFDVLDVGTGTGLIALMIAQRFPHAVIDAIDIAPEAVVEARENVMQSPFNERIRVTESSLQNFQPTKRYDFIVSNPPYFVNSLQNPDAGRKMARHAGSLTYRALFQGVARLLSEQGVFAAIIPSEQVASFLSEASISGFFVSKECRISTTPNKPVRRHLIAFTRHAPNALEMTEESLTDLNGERSKWYDDLTKDFYLPHPPSPHANGS